MKLQDQLSGREEERQKAPKREVQAGQWPRENFRILGCRSTGWHIPRPRSPIRLHLQLFPIKLCTTFFHVCVLIAFWLHFFNCISMLLIALTDH